MADRIQAAEILRNALAKRSKIAYFENKDYRLVAKANFPEFSQDAVEHLLDIGKSPSEITNCICMPEFWECRHKRAQTPQRAIELVLAEGRQRAAQTAAASASGLCILTGTPRQVEWAEKIRAAHLELHPDSKHREVAGSAWWIENRGIL
jgi:hypothetical protein